MRMKDRFCRIGKHLLGVACLLSTCGVTYSCSDDYDLDETKPSFLGQSIYDELNARDKFKTVIRLINDLDYKDVLSKTGSKTLFVADDNAYAQFFEKNPWGVKRYEDLTSAQKNLLLKGSMLDNAYVLEMMTTIQGPVKNLCLRQLTSVSATDSVPYFVWDKLPNNLNESTNKNPDPRYWDELRQQSKGGIYMALDKTVPMMTHFLQAQMKEKSITNKDISFILGLDGTDKEWNTTEGRSYIYDARVTEQDVTCLNGYFHVLDKVLVTPPNMAEAIRTCSKTSLFSAMLERFSIPNFDATLNTDFKRVTGNVADTAVYQKLYVAQRGQKGAISVDIHNKSLGSDIARLSYDPGWNAYAVANTTKEQDMGAMFVPTDAAMKKYFLSGVGRTLIENYGDRPNTSENLLHNLYQIPQNIIVKLINNLMKESFNATVPSKYLSIMNTAQDQMFSSYASEAQFKQAIDTVMLASNGVVYVMDDLITPPDYSSVSGPVLFDQGARVMNTAIHADDNFVKDNYANAPLRKFYSTYLLAMQSHFSLFVPVDSGFAKYGYVDPLSFASGLAGNYRYWSLIPTESSASTGKKIAINAQAYTYREDLPMNTETGNKLTGIQSLSDDDLDGGTYGPIKKQMITDMVDQHIVVHGDENGSESIENNRSYYIARSGAPVIVTNHGDIAEGKGMTVEGGFQKEVNHDDYPANNQTIKVEKGFDLSEGYGNGHAYFINRPMQPTVYNVYKVLDRMSAKEGSQYKKFFNLCSTFTYGSNENTLDAIFRKGNTNLNDNSKWNTEKNKYAIFAANSKGGNGRLTASGTSLVRFFNNYRYTMFVPTDEAIDAAHEAGLPTFEDIEAYVKENYTDNGGKWAGEPVVVSSQEKYTDVQLKAQAMYTCLINFLKYHFCDQSFFVDKYSDNGFTYSQSACSDSETNSFISVAIKHTANGMEIADASSMKNGVVKSGAAVKTVTSNSDYYNVFARDYELNDVFSKSQNYIKSSSYVVLQGLKGKDFLLFDSKWNGRFDNYWADSNKAKAFMKHFKLKK